MSSPNSSPVDERRLVPYHNPTPGSEQGTFGRLNNIAPSSADPAALAGFWQGVAAELMIERERFADPAALAGFWQGVAAQLKIERERCDKSLKVALIAGAVVVVGAAVVIAVTLLMYQSIQKQQTS